MACLLSIGNSTYNFWNGTIQSHLISKSINQSEIALIKNQRSNQYYPFPFPFFFPFFPLIELLYTIICNIQILIIKIMGKNLKFFSKFLKGKKRNRIHSLLSKFSTKESISIVRSFALFLSVYPFQFSKQRDDGNLSIVHRNLLS